MDDSGQIRVILSAYTCRPDAGSEPGTGWGWAIHLARAGCVVYLLTADRNRVAIETYLQSFPCPHLHPYFIKIPWMDSQSSNALHYIFWQYTALRFAKSLRSTECIDLVHHVCYGSAIVPTPLSKLGLPTLFGPVGGGQTAPVSSLFFFGKQRWKELIRTQFMQFLPRFWLYRVWVQKLSLIFAANSDTMNFLHNAGCQHVELLCDTGALEIHCASNSRSFTTATTISLLWVGRFMPRKGLTLALDALALSNTRVHLTIMGEGLTQVQMQELLAERNLLGRVVWKGSRASWEEVHQAYLDHDALLFTSLRDSFGSQNLEAMSAGLPIIALNLAGVRDFINVDVAIKVDIGTSPQETVHCLAEAIDRFSSLSITDRNQMSEAALFRAKSFLWTLRAEQMIEHYRRVLLARARST